MFFSSEAYRSLDVALRHVFLALVFAIWPISAAIVVHNGSFTPDAVLRVTAQDINLGGIRRLTTLVNGSIPGPELRIPEQEVAWIRVYNDMQDQNLSMVSWNRALDLIKYILNSVLALAWPRPSCSSILRRNATCESMADSSPTLVRL